MRRILVALTALSATAGLASPAAAQFYPGQPYGYANGGYGYNGYGQARSLHQRIDRIEWQINRMDRENAVPDGMAARLSYEARRLEDRLAHASRYGLNPYDANDIQVHIAQLEQRVRYAASNRYGRYGHGYRGYDNGYYNDRDGRGRWNGHRDNDDRDDD